MTPIEFVEVTESAAWYGDVSSTAAAAFIVGFCYDNLAFALTMALALEAAATVARGVFCGWTFAVTILCVVLGSLEPLPGCKLRMRATSDGGREFFLLSLVVAATNVWCRLLAKDATVEGFASGLLMTEVGFTAAFGMGTVVLELATTDRAESYRKTKVWTCLWIGASTSSAVGVVAPVLYGHGHGFATAALACAIAPAATIVAYLLLVPIAYRIRKGNGISPSLSSK